MQDDHENLAFVPEDAASDVIPIQAISAKEKYLMLYRIQASASTATEAAGIAAVWSIFQLSVRYLSMQ